MILAIIIMAAAIFLLLTLYIRHWLEKLFPSRYPRLSRRIFLTVGSVLLSCFSLCIFFTPGLMLFHFWILSMLTEPIFSLFRKPRRSPSSRFAHPAVCSLLLAALAVWGSYNISHPVRTNYVYRTAKDIRPAGYRILLITDTHFGTIQSPSTLESRLCEMNDLHPDLVILGGDIVEEGTDKAEMEQAFAALGTLESRFGTYYVYGNHDRQNYASAPAYSPDELTAAIAQNGISVLQDEAILINEDLLLAGREDPAWSSTGSRRSTADILSGFDRHYLTILCDHQPIDWQENAAAGADLQLSGHTHAGQIWPVGQLLELSGRLSYGHYVRDGMDIYVSSGFAGWGYPLRTSDRSEYVILDILPEA